MRVSQPKLRTGRTVNLDKQVDRKHKEDISYIGEFAEQLDGTWIGLANIRGLLCLVEIKLVDLPSAAQSA